MHQHWLTVFWHWAIVRNVRLPVPFTNEPLPNNRPTVVQPLENPNPVQICSKLKMLASVTTISITFTNSFYKRWANNLYFGQNMMLHLGVNIENCYVEGSRGIPFAFTPQTYLTTWRDSQVIGHVLYSFSKFWHIPE